MSSVPSALSSLKGTYGAFAITKDVSAILLGCLTVQTYLYFRSFPRDSLTIKFLLVLIWALELASYVVSSRLIYNLTIVNFGNVLALVDQFQEPLSIVLWLCAASIAFMESFYIVYICDVAGRRLWTICAAAVALLLIWLRCAGFLVIAIHVRREPLVPILNWLLKLELASGMVMEILIALVMAWFLRKRTFEDAEGPFKWVAWVLRWILQTGALAGIIASVNLGINPSKDNPFLFIGLVSVLSKVLSNCFVSSINGRRDLQGFTEMPLANSPLQESPFQSREPDDGNNPSRPNLTTTFRAFIRALNIFDLAPKGTAASNNINLDDEWRGQDPERLGTEEVQSRNQIQHAASGPGPMPQMVQQHSTPTLNTPILNITTQSRVQDEPGPGPSSLPMSVTRTKNRPPPPPHLPQPDSNSNSLDKEIQEISREPASRYGNLVPETQATGASVFTPSTSQVKPSSQSQHQKSQPMFIVANTTTSRTSGSIRSPAHTRNNTLRASGRESMDTLPSYRSRPVSPAPATPVSPGILSGKGKERESRTLPPLPRVPQDNDPDRTVDDSTSVVDMERSNGEPGEQRDEVQEDPEEREGAIDGVGPGSRLD